MHRLGSDLYRDVPVLLLGASGFIGRWVARSLTAARAELHLGIRNPGALDPLRQPYGIGGRVWRVDLEQPDVVSKLLGELRPAVVFNLAGYGVRANERREARAESVNAAVPAELARACADVVQSGWPGRSLVHAGSALEYGPVAGTVRETLPATPTTSYGRTKLAGARAIETICDQSELRAVVARMFTVFGPGEPLPRLLPTLLAARHTRAPLELTDGVQKRDFVYVEEVAEALLGLGVSAQPGYATVNVATGTPHSVREFVTAAAEVLALDPARLRFGALPHRSGAFPISRSSV